MRHTSQVQSESTTGTDGRDDALTPTDLTIVDALSTAGSGRAGVVLLRVAAALIAVVGVIGSALTAANYLSPGNSDSLLADPEPRLRRWGVFVSGLVVPLGLASVVLGLSYLLAIHRSRLELEIVAVEENEQVPEAG